MGLDVLAGLFCIWLHIYLTDSSVTSFWRRIIMATAIVVSAVVGSVLNQLLGIK